MKYTSSECEQRAVLQVADSMLAAIRTAPKACGQDHLESMVLTGEDKAKLAEAMREFSLNPGKENFGRDAGNLDAADAVVLVGLRNEPYARNCGLCGCETCAEAVKKGIFCTYGVTDLGIAVGSAAALASDFHIDNRIMFTVGKLAVATGLFSERVKVAYGIPLSVKGKSPFYDRG